MRALTRWHRDEQGATTVEVAIAVGAFLLILLGVLEFAIDMWIWNSMTMAVQQGGRKAMVYYQTPTNQGTSCDDAWTGQVQTVVQSYLPGSSANYTLGHTCTAAASRYRHCSRSRRATRWGRCRCPARRARGLSPASP